MLRITAAIDHCEPDLPWAANRLRVRDRYYLDDRGHAWRAARYRTLTAWRHGRLVEPAEPGEFCELNHALREMGRLRARYREAGQPDTTRRRALFGRWRVVRVTTPRSDGEGGCAGGGAVERFDLVELAAVPVLVPDDRPAAAPELRPVDLGGWTLTDWTDEAREREEENRAWRKRDEHRARRRARFGNYDWHDRGGFLKLVRPSKTTKTATAHYVERAGRWRRIGEGTSPEDPAQAWTERDTVEVCVRVNDPRLCVAIYKRRGPVESFHDKLARRIYHAYDHVLETADGQRTQRRVVRAPGQEAAALRMLMDQARRDLAPTIAAEAKRKRERAAGRRSASRSAATVATGGQLAFF